jgi:hypothetical protein
MPFLLVSTVPVRFAGNQDHLLVRGVSDGSWLVVTMITGGLGERDSGERTRVRQQTIIGDDATL